MVVVFWLEGGGEPAPRSRAFPPDALGEALAFAEQLRKRRAGGELISHVAIQSELAESVGSAGVADPDPGYSHYKRRLDPSTPLGRVLPRHGPS